MPIPGKSRLQVCVLLINPIKIKTGCVNNKYKQNRTNKYAFPNKRPSAIIHEWDYKLFLIRETWARIRCNCTSTDKSLSRKTQNR